MKNFRWTVLAALILAAPQVVHAQEATTSTTTTQGAGAITNAPAAPGATGVDGTATTSTTVTTTTDVAPEADVIVAEQQTELADTGGAPILMSLSGLAMAAAAFGLRRKISA